MFVKVVKVMNVFAAYEEMSTNALLPQAPSPFPRCVNAIRLFFFEPSPSSPATRFNFSPALPSSAFSLSPIADSDSLDATFLATPKVPDSSPSVGSAGSVEGAGLLCGRGFGANKGGGAIEEEVEPSLSFRAIPGAGLCRIVESAGEWGMDEGAWEEEWE